MSEPDEAEIAAIRSQLLDGLERLDALGLHEAGAHLAMAIHCLEPGSFDCPQALPTPSPDG